MKLDITTADEEKAALAWLESEAGQEWSRLEHLAIAEVLCQSHRAGALFATLEPPEPDHDDDTGCCRECVNGHKASRWMPDPGELEVLTDDGAIVWEPGLDRLSSPA